VYWAFKKLGFDVSVNEDPSTGGVDFAICREGFTGVVEATTLLSSTIATRTGLPDGLATFTGSFAPVNASLFGKVSGKAKQMGRENGPRILSIVVTHSMASMLFSSIVLDELLVGKTVFRIPIGSPKGEIGLMTSLQDSIFWQLGEDDTPINKRASISAVILILVAADHFQLHGLINPEATNPIDPQFLAGVPSRYALVSGDKLVVEMVGPKRRQFDV